MKQIIKDFLNKNNGQITTEDLSDLNMSPQDLLYLERIGELDRVDRGIYTDPRVIEDDLFAIQYRFKKGIFFKDTSLFLNDMSDRTPQRYEMNFPTGYHSASLKNYPVIIYRQKIELYKIGIEKIKSPGNHLINCYNIERTLCDILRKKDSSDIEIIKQALESYAKMKDKNWNRLNEYAKIFKVQEKLNDLLGIVM